MRLHEHPDFAAFVTAAAAERDLAEPFVEKDYWITEILRVIATTLPDRAIFKGSTSLSKGWALLDRFSEDIDLFVDPVVDPPLAKRALDRTLKTLSKDVVAIGGLELAESATIGGFGRIDTFGYSSLFSGIAGFPPTVRLEPGIQSGKQPTEDVEISSFVADLLRARGATKELDDVDGLEPFTMTLLHFRRTFVEKLFALHGKVERLKADGHPLGVARRRRHGRRGLAGLGPARPRLETPPTRSAPSPPQSPGSRGPCRWPSKSATCSRPTASSSPNDRADLVFPGERGEYLDDSALRRRYKKALKTAKLRPLRFHDPRRTFGSIAIGQATIIQVQAWMGHSDVQTTMKYMHHRCRAGDARLLSAAFRPTKKTRRRRSPQAG